MFVSQEHWGLLKLNPLAQGRYVEYVDRYYPHVECYYPRYERVVRPHGSRGRRRVWSPIFPGYLFVRVKRREMPELVTLPVRAYWIRFGENIEIVPDIVIKRLRELELAGELVREVMHVEPYRVGVQVRVHLEVGDIRAVVVKRGPGDRVVVDSVWCRCVVPRHLLEVI
jgi:hypothetical protein